MRNGEILISTLFIILVVFITDIEPQTVKPNYQQRIRIHLHNIQQYNDIVPSSLSNSAYNIK